MNEMDDMRCEMTQRRGTKGSKSGTEWRRGHYYCHQIIMNSANKMRKEFNNDIDKRALLTTVIDSIMGVYIMI
jgi:extradiol dioxygenase family protein